MSAVSGMRYEANPKHKEPWQPGRKGSLCPKWSHGHADVLLAASLMAPGGKQRYATLRGIAFGGQEHLSGVWHGYPIAWAYVPPAIKNRWIEEGRVTRKQIRDSWNELKRSADE